MCQKYKDLQKDQTTLTQDVGSDEIVARGFSQDACRRATMKIIVLDELPFSIVENPNFKHFCSVAAPTYLLPSQRTITRDTLDMYVEEKAKLKSLLIGNKHRVSLTTDIWTSITTVSYMVITAHFIDKDWNLHKKIINFNTINDHSSMTIVDYASPNEGALRYLIDRLKTWRDDVLVLNEDYLHVRCCAHILNLIVTERLKELELSIVSVRNAVKYVRSSTAGMQAFQIHVQQEKINCQGSVILDCPTRWNSTYSMLSTALKFKPAFDRMALEDKLYDAYFNEKDGGKKKMEGPPMDSDWESARHIIKFFKTFYDATLQFSSSLKVTSNTCYNLICQIEQSLESLSAGGSGSASGSASGSQTLAIGSGSGSNFWDLGGGDDVMIEDPFSKFSKAVAGSECSPELSRSAFSTGDRILDQYRSSSTPDMVEALVLLHNWLRSSLFVDPTVDLNKLVENNEFMDKLAEGDMDGGCSCGLFVTVDIVVACVLWWMLRLVLWWSFIKY
ncbi:BED-type domain-containing protein [Citrus sinensis]|uniref:BED-type domain-containing protein n=1 Tax=Citrus sinensis TaxID=2711 RepID=A0ACB8LBP1_CITSI|nr:BED-type domain-containing protein [Citrus sinensis]